MIVETPALRALGNINMAVHRFGLHHQHELPM
jgi:hypothetical protein